MQLVEKVQELAAQWQQHCRRVSFSSNTGDYLNHPAYRQLIELGPAAVPLIMRRYQTDGLPWEFVLQEITGVRFIDNSGAINGADVQRRRLEWWAHEQAHYPAPPSAGE